MGDEATEGLEIYLVGGAVRDQLMGLPAGDRDWVVVGADPETMLVRGFQPVGIDFPVFLHPVTKEEYALARTERKSGRGYKGFTFHTGKDVTLLDDLKRRDLTMNAIAQTPDGTIIDPLHGQQDIRSRQLRHVGEAFSEDPVRLLRLARFAARFPEFTVAPETAQLARQLVEEGEVDALVPERVWQELAKGLMATSPGRMMDVLEQAGALNRVLPGLTWLAESADELACAHAQGLPLASRYALLCRHTQDVRSLSKHLRAPRQCLDYALLLPVMLTALAAPSHSPSQQWQILTRADALRRSERFHHLLQAAQCVQAVDIPLWMARLGALREIDTASVVAAAQGDADAIRRGLEQARLQALQAYDQTRITSDDADHGG